ncbi:MAG: hypothetical protein DRQ51_01370 [Gammaproteobacteria bacterium]|nr:MAG: hypothetical protein DRQ51_01370 [Gammaproteobacteria bacterium]
MNYEKKIINSDLYFKIKIIAKEVFLQWLDKARRTYNISPLLYNKIKNDNVESIFLEHLKKAIKSLIEDKSEDKKSISGWSFGFLCGHLQGSIDYAWFHKYVVECSKDYEDLMKIKAIIAFLKWNNESLDKIFTIYKHLLEHRVEPIKSPETIPDNIIPIFNNRDSNLFEENEFKKETIVILSNLLKTKYKKLSNNKKSVCCPSIDKYLKIDDIKNIVGIEHFA